MHRPIRAGAGTLMLVAGLLGWPGTGVADSALPATEVPGAGCRIADDSALRATGTTTADGHYAHEEWVAGAAGQAVVARVNEVLSQRFGTDTEHAPTTTLAAGLIGATVDHAARELVVVVDQARTDTAALRADLTTASTGSGVGVRVVPGCHSATALLQAAQILSAARWHPAAASAAYGYLLEPRDSTYHVTFRAEDVALAKSLADQLGSRVTVDFGSPARRDRQNDGEPHYGGAGIRRASQSSNTCTAGPVIRTSSGVRGAVSAGHCFDNGNSIYSGTQFYGNAGGDSGFPTYDMIRVTSSAETYANVIHVDPCCPSTRTVTGRANPPLNEYLCVTGMRTLAKCGLRVTNTNATFCDGGCTPNLFVAEKPGETVGQGGDSGAPVYIRPTTTTATIRGMEIAGTRPDNIYAHKISTVESHLSVTVATS